MIRLPQWYNAPQRVTAVPPRLGGRPSISVIVPTRNEADNLLPVLAMARPFADELLVIDCDSHDGTREIAAACGARVIVDSRRGKGIAIRRGIEEATGDILVFIDADGSHNPRDIPALVAPILADEADHVSGSRMLGGSGELHATLHQFVRLFGSQVITLSINYTFGVRLTDCQNGFRAIRREVVCRLGLAERITTIEQEMIIKTLHYGYRICEVATHEYERANGESKFRVKDVWFRYIVSLFYYLFIWRPPRRGEGTQCAPSR